MTPSVRVQRLRRDIGIVGPNDRASLWVSTKPVKVLEITKGLKDTAIVEQVGEVHIGR